MHDLSFVKGITGSSLPSHLSDERITSYPLTKGCKFAGRRVDGSAERKYTRRKQLEPHQIEYIGVHIEHGKNGKEQKEEKAKYVPILSISFDLSRPKSEVRDLCCIEKGKESEDISKIRKLKDRIPKGRI